jgi:hypothetical protein
MGFFDTQRLGTHWQFVVVEALQIFCNLLQRSEVTQR